MFIKITVNLFSEGCGPDRLPCEFESRCYNISYRCDGIPDCIADFELPIVAEDELSCPQGVYSMMR